MEFFKSLSILLIIATLFSYINARFLKFPSTIGLMIIAIIFSVGLVVLGKIDSRPLNDLSTLVRNVDFTQLLMGGMLYFLLFAGAIQIDINDFKEQKRSIIIFSTLSVIISTFVVGFILYYLFQLIFPLIGISLEVSLVYCLLFGALISPTDPVAVLSILRQAKVKKSLETTISGESLFNDRVAVILFTVLFNIAQGTEQIADITFASISWLLVKEVFGAILVGLALGGIAFYAIRIIPEPKLTILITLSVVISGFMISQAMEISGPLTMVTAGLLIGNASRTYSKARHLDMQFEHIFWELIDDILNAILFLMIGFELLLMPDLSHYWILGVISIIVVLFARYISIRIPTLVIPFREKFSSSTMTILVWGGLRGGVSIALALSLGDSPHREPLVAVTYFVVVFSIIVQGLSVGKLAKRIGE